MGMSSREGTTLSETTTPARRPEVIESEMAAARQRIADNIESLFTELHPKAQVHRTVNEAKAFAAEQVDQAKSAFREPDGTWRTGRLIAISGAVVGVFVFALIVRGISKPKAR